MRLRSHKDTIAQPPPRPYLPPLFICGIAFWIGCGAAYAYARMLDAETLAPLSAVLGLGSALVVIVGFVKRKVVMLALCALLAGSGLGCARGFFVLATESQFSDGGQWSGTCVLAGDPSRTRSGFTCDALIQGTDGSRVSVVLSLKQAEGLACGRMVQINESKVTLDAQRSDYLWRRAARASLTVRAFETLPSSGIEGMLYDLREKARATLDDGSEAGLLLAAIVCGWRQDLSSTHFYETFKACGLSHLVAVSGAHIVIVSSAIAVLLKALRCPRRISIILQIVFMAGYFVLAGEPVSALRACVMASLGMLSYFGRRRSSTLNSIGIAIFVLICLAPESSLSSSFSLSCLSTLGIAVFAPLASALLRRTPIGRVGFLSDAFALTLAASIAAQPYACALFAELPLVSFLANGIIAPIFPLACSIGLIAGITAPFALPNAAILVDGAKAAASPLLIASDILSSLPYSCVPIDIGEIEALILSACAMLALYFLWPTGNKRAKGSERVRFRRLAPALLAVVALIVVFTHVNLPEEAIIMLDVGQGDSFLIESEGATLLIDTGNQDAKLLSALARHHITHLDAVLITHSDDDHCGSLDALRTCVDVGSVLVAHDMLACDDAKARDLIDNASSLADSVVGLTVGDRIRVGAFTGVVVWPERFSDNGGNADSVCLYVEYDPQRDGIADATALFTGDAEIEELRRILELWDLNAIDILKVGHHGSRNGIDQQTAHALSPTIALIGVGAGNRYGHPTSETLTCLDEAGAQIFRSDDDGDVSCIMRANSIEVETQR